MAMDKRNSLEKARAARARNAAEARKALKEAPKNAMESVERMHALLGEAHMNLSAWIQKGNKSAGRRARQNMIQMAKMRVQVNRAIMAIDQRGREEK